MQTGIDIRQFRDLIIRPTLSAIGLGGVAAEELMIGTVLQESGGGHWLHQVGQGPACGVGQMEPVTHDDIWTNFLDAPSRHDLASRVTRLMIPGLQPVDQLQGNLYYAIAMVRLRYYRVKAALPAAGDLPGQAAYWKTYYNTPAGGGTVSQYMSNYLAAQASLTA